MKKIFLALSIVGLWCFFSKTMDNAPLIECVTEPSIHANNVVKAVQNVRDARIQDSASRDKLEMWSAALKNVSPADKQWCKECKGLWLQGLNQDFEKSSSESHQVLFDERCMYPLKGALYNTKPTW